ncbi:MAG: SurA N-terminal domain-containing protein [Candidatus Omnitrophica bacterium]|nr:SurA N-terminal domain-containing protein [Candidatus Omnitrophota bacterium]
MKIFTNRAILQSLFISVFFVSVSLFIAAEELGRILAKVNNEVITSRDLDDYCAVISYKLSENDPDFNCNGSVSRKKALDRLIEDKLILAEAKREAFEVPEEWIAAKYQKAVDSYPSRDLFENSLIQRGLTVPGLKEKIKEQFLTQMALQRRIRVMISVSPPEIVEYYNRFKDRFVSQPIYVFWIGKSKDIPKLAEMTESQYKEVLNRIEASISELKPDIAKPLSTLEPKQSEIFTMDGFEYVIYLESIKAAKSLSLEESQEIIKSLIWQEKFTEKFESWIAGLKKEAIIKIYEESL